MKHLNYTGNALLFFIGTLFFLSLTNCEKSADNTSQKVNLDALNTDNYPKVDGSTSTHPLQVLIASKILGVDYSWMPGWFDETYRIWPSSDKKPDIARFIMDSIVHNGTHSAYVNLINEKADVIIVARTASEDEIHQADSLGVTLKAVPVALDAFVFIVNVNNSVNSLNVKEIQDIYTGKTKNWDQVGGRNTEIHPYQRNPNSGSQELMLSLVMKDLEMTNFPEMILFGMMGPINQISIDWDGLGYTVYFFEKFMAPNDGLKLLAVNGVLPSYNSLRTKEYIYTTEVYGVIREDLEESSTAHQLFRWLVTKEGQEAIEECGYIPYY